MITQMNEAAEVFFVELCYMYMIHNIVCPFARILWIKFRKDVRIKYYSFDCVLSEIHYSDWISHHLLFTDGTRSHLLFSCLCFSMREHSTWLHLVDYLLIENSGL